MKLNVLQKHLGQLASVCDPATTDISVNMDCELQLIVSPSLTINIDLEKDE